MLLFECVLSGFYFVLFLFLIQGLCRMTCCYETVLFYLFSDERVDNSNVASVSSLHTVVLGIIH